MEADRGITAMYSIAVFSDYGIRSRYKECRTGSYDR